MNTARNVPELFGSMVFNETVMKERLPKDVYRKLKKTMREGTAIDADVAAVVATAMKDWALSKGERTIPTGSSRSTAFRPKSMIPLSLRRTTAA